MSRICSTRAGSISTSTGPAWVGGHREGHAVAQPPGAARRHHHLRQLGEVDRSRSSGSAPASSAGELQLLLHQPLQPPGLLGHGGEELARWRSLTSPSSSSRKPLRAAIGVFSSWDTLATRSRRARSRRRSSVTSRSVTTVPDDRCSSARGATVTSSSVAVLHHHRAAVDRGGAGRARGEHGVQDRGRQRLEARRLDALPEPQQPVGGVVRHDDGAVRVDRQHALGQRPDHRPVAVALPGDLRDERLEARPPCR